MFLQFLSGILSNLFFFALHVNTAMAFPKPLSPKEEADCFARLAQGDSQARAMLIEHNLRLVVYIAKKFDNTGIGVEDLISIGTIGLIKAVETFDAAKGSKFATYAGRCIEKATVSLRL